mmetsp:Transcript_25777/g.56500  ORF Transcript_25777/g.56500 Transcript_25777/m.56500 type:complete len:104 (+) Transcript_25777:1506-1817(+)
MRPLLKLTLPLEAGGDGGDGQSAGCCDAIVGVSWQSGVQLSVKLPSSSIARQVVYDPLECMHNSKDSVQLCPHESGFSSDIASTSAQSGSQDARKTSIPSTSW